MKSRPVKAQPDTPSSASEHTKRLKKLYELSMELSGDPIEVFVHVARMIGELMRVRVVCLSEVCGDELNFVSVYVDGEIITDAGSCPLSITPCATVESDKKVQVYDRVIERFPQASFLKQHDAYSYCGFPALDSNGDVVAVTCLLDDKPHEFSEEDQELLRILGQRIAIEIERKRHIEEQVHVEEELTVSKEELISIMNSMNETIYRVDADGLLTMVSPGVKRLLGYEPEELIGTRMEDLYVNSMDRMKFLNDLFDHNGEAWNYEMQLKHRDGSIVWVSTNAHYMQNDTGEVIGVEGVTRDVTERHKAEEHTHKLSSAIEQTADLVMITDRDGTIEYVNSAFVEITGYTRAEAIGKKPNIISSMKQNRNYYEEMWEVIGKGNVFTDVVVNKKKDGELFYEEKTITPLKDSEGNIFSFISTGKDITDRMNTQKQLQFLAHHDILTELPNRTLFTDRLDHALTRAHWHNRIIALMFLDLDRFKRINDTLGHDVGDQALQALSERLNVCVREGDTVARIGGDEFAILLEDISSTEDIAPMARKVLDALSDPFELHGHEFVITTSIGISIYPTDGEDSHTLLKNADIAMYRSKEEGRNTYQFYSSEMSSKAFERLALESNLRRALEKEEFCLYYQPQVDTRTNKIIGVEALIRWQHPDLGLVPPNDFIPLLEDTGLIVPVGEWVLRTACVQARNWQKAGHEPIRMAINLSSRQFSSSSLIEQVEHVLHDTGLAADCLEFEITESLIMQQNKVTLDVLQGLSSMGVHLAIDDFGIGYSSLSYLKKFPIDTIKIDRSFINDVTTDPDDAAIVQAIIAMARSLKHRLVGEGIETGEQLDFLQGHDCYVVQGFLFSRPLPADEIEKLLSAGLLNAQVN